MPKRNVKAPEPVGPPAYDPAVLVLAEFLRMRDAGDPNGELVEQLAHAVVWLRREIDRLRRVNRTRTPKVLRP